ncbi:class A beta-lactamase-related serine hydrolase [Lentibacillus sp. CBA3610]|nr:class A beta-lactamase-related serine hydrolase [Lentibacillus sp. CBA3610]
MEKGVLMSRQKDVPLSQNTIDKTRLGSAFDILSREIEAQRLPGAAAVVGREDVIVGSFASGNIMLDPSVKDSVNKHTIFDCASLTKVVVTLPLVMMLIEKGLIELSEPVSTYIPAFQTEAKSLVTIRHLLTHTSGLKPHISEDVTSWKPDEVKQFIYSQELDRRPGECVVYSDLGFILLGDIIEIILNKPLDEAANEYIFNPIGMADTYFNPPEQLKSRIAATEFREDAGRFQWGEVHD